MSPFHLVEELDFSLSADRFLAAFPRRRASTFVLDGGSGGRFAFMGAEPIATLRATRVGRDRDGRAIARVTIGSDRGATVAGGVDPFEALRDLLAEHAPPPGAFANAPFPFRAGAIGYVGYECGQLLERLPCAKRPGVAMPDMAFGVHDWVLVREEAGSSWLSVLGSSRAAAEATRDRVLRALATTPEVRNTKDARVAPSSIRSPRAARSPARSLSADEYLARVVTAKEHIAAGDAFEICLTNALRAPLSQDDARALFRELRASNPAPFAALLDLPEGAVVSSSPERFLSLDEEFVAESRPIKGTRPRGATPEEDAGLARELAASEKDRAENAMIVDLVRNDLGRVCRFGTVHVPELFAVESYATVHQLVSTVRGVLDRGKDGVDLIRACFPPGSMTGAPKIEAMTILERLEPVERGVYAGALGWIDLGGAMDLSVVIRTAIVKDGAATFSAGGAIVADSDPIAEREEAEHKAAALVRAIEAVTKRSSAARVAAVTAVRTTGDRP